MAGASDDGKILNLLRAVIDDMEKRTRLVADQVENEQLSQFFADCAEARTKIAAQVDEVIAELDAGDVSIDHRPCCPLSDFEDCGESNASGDYGGLLEQLAVCEDKYVEMIQQELDRDDLSATVRLAIDEAVLIAQKTGKQYRRIAEQAGPLSIEDEAPVAGNL